ncbi:hypothetical protein COLO4_14196 [Corchorus olitorius]|uniref:Uncharacterized protein n=1 Tax=Corchorus olitorius TaxID=93759 RepID=A0A1R3JT33_9ROSI|nr:hypothetical protein COLO4_14196 [Corchorus olitorius]
MVLVPLSLSKAFKHAPPLLPARTTPLFFTLLHRRVLHKHRR